MYFVILLHQHPCGDHWDIMLETVTKSDKRTLRTWAIAPQPIPTETAVGAGKFECLAKILPDHRLHYLDYEGVISDNRGTVRRIDAGTYQTVCLDCFQLDGQLFRGILSVSEPKNQSSEVLLLFTPNRTN